MNPSPAPAPGPWYCFDLPESPCRQALGATRLGSENSGFQENTSAHFLRPGPGDWSLHIDDEPLPLVETDAGPAWRWTPGFYAGEVTAELIDTAGRTRSRFLLDVAPSPHKLGREVFAAMVEEIWAWDPVLVVGTEPASRHVGRLGEYHDLFIAFARLRRHAPAALRSLQAIAREPIRRLRARRDRLPLNRIRRIDLGTLTSLVAQPGLAAALTSAHATPGIETGLLLDCPTTEHELDCAANRCITAACRRLLTRVRRIQQRMQQAVDREDDSPTRTALSARWPVRRRFLSELARELSTLLRQIPYAAVTRLEITAAGLTAVASHPHYASAYRRAWLAYAPGVTGPPSDERLWISPTWEIFERWCFVRMTKVLEATRGGPWQRLYQHPTRATAALQRQLAGGGQLTLLLQPDFPAGDQADTRHCSISGRRLPDIAMLLESTDACRWFAFDAKYRGSRTNLLDAMSSAHIYHDALRWSDSPPERALLLAPAARGVDWLLEPAFHRQHGVGIVRVDSEANWGWLPALLRDA